MMAHVNTAGIHVPLWMDSGAVVNGTTPVGWGIDRTNYPMQEGTFFGDILDSGSLTNIGKGQITGPAAYFCDGAGYPAGAAGVVAGRLGANQANAPYKNPYGNGTMCQSVLLYNNPVNSGHFSNGIVGSCPSGSNANPSQGCPDGYSAMQYPYSGSAVPWNNSITVWRNNNYRPVFDAGYIYRISPLTTNMGQSVDVCNGSTAVGTCIQQYSSYDGIPQKLTLVADGSNWRIAMTSDPSKCVDLAGGGTANGTKLQIQSCTAGKTSQQYTITPDAPTGAFIFKNVASGRCLDQPGSNTAAGVQLDIWDCNGGNNQKWNIQAYSSTN